MPKGGKREGAGRKPSGKTTFNICLPPETAAALVRRAKRMMRRLGRKRLPLSEAAVEMMAGGVQEEHDNSD